MESNVIPFMRLAEVYDRVQRDKFGELLGDCKVCNAKAVQVFQHPCFREIYKRFRESYAKSDT